jgi:[acyl-carrier-protein] S-malonyltransferase
MRVVLGMQEQEIQAILAEGKEAWIANVNCPGQVVIAGTLQGLESAAEALKKGGAKRVLPLEVSGAFHSPLMKSAQEALTPAFMSVALSDSSIRPVMNTPGDFVDDVASIRAFLIKQVTHPVYWQQGILSMVKQQVDGFIEIGCGKTLQGMYKRIGIPLPTFSVEKVEELEGLATAIME